MHVGEGGGGESKLHYVDEVTGITLGKGWESYILWIRSVHQDN